MKIQNRSIFCVERIEVRGSFNYIGGIVYHHNSNKRYGNTEVEIKKGNPEKTGNIWYTRNRSKTNKTKNTPLYANKIK